MRLVRFGETNAMMVESLLGMPVVVKMALLMCYGDGGAFLGALTINSAFEESHSPHEYVRAVRGTNEARLHHMCGPTETIHEILYGRHLRATLACGIDP